MERESKYIDTFAFEKYGQVIDRRVYSAAQRANEAIFFVKGSITYTVLVVPLLEINAASISL